MRSQIIVVQEFDTGGTHIDGTLDAAAADMLRIAPVLEGIIFQPEMGLGIQNHCLQNQR